VGPGAGLYGCRNSRPNWDSIPGLHSIGIVEQLRGQDSWFPSDIITISLQQIDYPGKKKKTHTNPPPPTLWAVFLKLLHMPVLVVHVLS
jgi:hypothetical protein